jgi:Tfp pilus assembly major pilin PilA
MFTQVGFGLIELIGLIGLIEILSIAICFS